MDEKELYLRRAHYLLIHPAVRKLLGNRDLLAELHTQATIPAELAQRYFILLRKCYRCELDETSWASSETLEQAEAIIKMHLFQKPRKNYSTDCIVLDLNRARLLPWYEVSHIVFAAKS